MKLHASSISCFFPATLWSGGALVGASALLVAISGCGNGTGRELAPVAGQVTLDGEPLRGAQIMFQPQATGGSPSYGATDQDGRYELGFKRGVKGAMIGSHSVRIDMSREVAGPNGKVTRPKPLPPRYNVKTELRAEVKSEEDNAIDFELTSDGK
jgi:hypothetical protein